MSGINEIKKKTKLSIDEMYDNQSVKLDVHKDVKPEIKQTTQPVGHPVNSPDSHPVGNPIFQEISHPTIQNPVQSTTHQNGMLETNAELKTVFPTTKQQIPKASIYKMTFNLPEGIYKAFNDLYANRMLQGRKTEKSEMICEAIQWLIKMEND